MSTKALSQTIRTLAKLVLLTFGPLVMAQQAIAKDPTRFITLGTMGGPLPHAERSQPSNALMTGDEVYLVDVGDGTAGQLAKAGIALAEVDGIFISHLHADHMSGLGAIIMLRLAALSRDPIDVYGPPGTKELVDGLISASQPLLETGYGQGDVTMPDPNAIITVTEVTDGWVAPIEGMRVSAVRNSHFGDASPFLSLAYRFDLPEGSIVYTGDTGPSLAVETLAQGADILFAEMIDLEVTLARVKRLNPDFTETQFAGIAKHLAAQHLTPNQVGAMAKRGNVSRVVVTHLVPGTMDEDRIADYVRRISSQFDGHVTIAKDLEAVDFR